MNVLFVSSGNNLQGISPIVKRQGESLIRQSVNIDFFTIKGKGVLNYFRNIFILRNFISNKKYDIIHAHFGFCGIISLLAKRKELLVVSFMGTDLLGYKRNNGSVTVKSLLMIFFNRWISRIFFDAVIVKSSEMSQKIGKMKNLFLIANGIDTYLFQPLSKEECKKNLSWSNNEFHILFAADPRRTEKNFMLATDAVKLLNGNGRYNLHYLKDIAHKDVPEYLNASDIILLTSMHEGSPNVIKEAMACNCPIVSTNVGDVQQVIGNTEGCFITVHNPEEIAKEIKNALRFKERTNGRQRIIEMGLDSETVAQKIINVYRLLLKKQKNHIRQD